MPDADPTTLSSMRIAVLTVSDTRDMRSDKSGDILAELLTKASHQLVEKRIVKDDIYKIRAVIASWCADRNIDVILTTGGTGMTDRDVTPEAVTALLDKEISGFGEIFRLLSFDEIGTSSLQSRAMAGICNGVFIFCLPGSPGACNTAWNKLIKAQLDSKTKPCNLINLLPRIRRTRPL